MKQLILAIFCLMTCSTLSAQQIEQKARTRKISYSQTKEIIGIDDVRVKVETEERSNKEGDLVLKISKNKDNTFCFTQIYKMGYTLISPSPEQLSTKRYSLNSAVEIDIVLANNQELSDERARIEQNIWASLTKEVAALEQRVKEQDSLINTKALNESDFTIIKSRRDSLQNEITKFYDNYNNVARIISEESDKLSKIDYITLDSIEIKNIELLKAGNGDEVIKYNKSLLPDNHLEIAANLSKEIEENEKEIKKAEEVRDFLTRKYTEIAKDFYEKGTLDSAAHYLELRANLDQNNAIFNKEYADFLVKEFNEHDKAAPIYTHILATTENSPQNSELLISTNISLGEIYAKRNEISLALKYYQTAYDISKKSHGRSNRQSRTIKKSIKNLKKSL